MEGVRAVDRGARLADLAIGAVGEPCMLDEMTRGRESKPIESSPESHDAAKAKRLWNLGNELLGLPDWP